MQLCLSLHTQFVISDHSNARNQSKPLLEVDKAIRKLQTDITSQRYVLQADTACKKKKIHATPILTHSLMYRLMHQGNNDRDIASTEGQCTGALVMCMVHGLYCTRSLKVNPLTSVSHCSGFKVREIDFSWNSVFGSSLYTRQILEILCLQFDLFLIVECIWYILGHV